MKTWKKTLLYTVSGLVALVLIFGVAIYTSTQARIHKTYHVTIAAPDLPTDSVSLALGRHLAATRGCMDCHGLDLAGSTVVDDKAIGVIHGPNLTPGSGSVTRSFNDADWVRAIRHGVAPDGHPLLMMPSYEYYYLSDTDLDALIAYLKTLPPVDRTTVPVSIGPVGRTLLFAGKMPTLIAAESIDHNAPRPDAPPPGVTIDYGEYLAVGCTGCHGKNLSGGPIPGVPPSWPPAQNITPDKETGIGTWSEADFMKAMHEGIRPNGTTIDPVMPWKQFKQMKDTELKALWLYLRSVQPQQYASR